MRGRVWISLVALLAWLTGIGAAAAQERGLVGFWQGKYDCNQGITGVTLTIRAVTGTEVEGLFLFYEVPENPGVPTGCYVTTGTWDPASRAVTLLGHDDRWLWRPENYIAVNFRGTMAPGGLAMRGRVEGPNCTVFDLRRIASAPRAPEPCTRAMNMVGGGGGQVATRQEQTR